MTERWLPIAGFVGVYEISDLGRVRRVAPAKGATVGKIMAARPNRDGYLRVSLWNSPNPPVDKLVHILVLEAFVGLCPAGMEACHCDGNSGNAALSNLRWGTPVENAADRCRHGTQALGVRHGNARLTEDQVREIRIAIGRKWSHLV